MNPLNTVIKAAFPLAIAGGLLAVYRFLNLGQSSFFLQCPFYYFTGLYCPGCGSLRAIHHLTHFDAATALGFNVLLVLSLPLVVYALAVAYINFVFGSTYRVAFFYNKGFIVVYFVTAVLFWVLRNIPKAPFSYLAPG